MRILQERLPLDSLRLDPQNPRLPEDRLGADQDEILSYLFQHEVLSELADSYVTNGYFPNEQLIVLPPAADGSRVVVEGNRRLGALKYLLRDPTAVSAGLPAHVTDPGLDEMTRRELSKIPAVEVKDSEELASYLGFRHINGPRTWASEAKARYLYTEVRDARDAGDPQPFYTIGRRVGSNALGVRNSFHAYNTLRVAREELDLRELATYVLSHRFGVWTRLLGTANVASYIGIAKFGPDFESVISSTANMNRQNTEEVLSDLRPAPGRTRPLLNDSRDVTEYSTVLAHDVARAVLRQYERLDLAAEIANGSSFNSRLDRVHESIQVSAREVFDGVAVTGESARLANLILKESKNLVALIAVNLDDAGMDAPQ